MIVVGLWLAIVGYGVAYAGMRQLAGADCSVMAAFQGKCGAAAATRSTTAGSSGLTLLSSQQRLQDQQASIIGTQPLQVA